MHPGIRPAAYAGLLIAGECAGFAGAGLTSAWPYAAACLLWGACVSWGWCVRGTVPILVFLLGVVLAARTEATHGAALAAHWTSGASPPVLDLEVEEDACEMSRRDGRRNWTFPSHFGVLPLKVVLPADERRPRRGETWRCDGWIARVALYPGHFARRMFWGRTGRPVADGRGAGRRMLARFSDACARAAARGLGWCPNLATLNQAILLGRRANLSPVERRIFADAGTIHVFAISGLHVMLVALLLMQVIAWTGIPIRVRGLVALLPLAFYVVVTGARPSAVRAGVMAAFYLTAPAFGRRADLLTSWALTALLVYGFSPARVFDTGCTLSFVVMLGIVLWLAFVHPCLPERFQDGIWGGMGVSLAAWIAGVPVTASVFGRFTVGGLVANLAVLPLAGFAVAFGLSGLICGLLNLPLAFVFNNLAAGMTEGMRLISTLVAACPGASVVIAPWPPLNCGIWYAGALTAFWVFRQIRLQRMRIWWRTSKTDRLRGAIQ